jgi:hypothetical protein
VGSITPQPPFRSCPLKAGRAGTRAGVDVFGETKNLLTLPDFEDQIVQPVANYYID